MKPARSSIPHIRLTSAGATALLTALSVALCLFVQPCTAFAQTSTTNTNEFLVDPYLGLFGGGDFLFGSSSGESTGSLSLGGSGGGLPLDGGIEASNQAVESYVLLTVNMYAFQEEKNNNPPYAGTYNNGATELANYANSGSFGNTPGAAAFRTFTINGNDETATARPLQVGDTFTITSYVGSNPSGGGYIGISFRDSTTYSSFFDSTDGSTEARFQIDDSGNWKVYHNGGTTTSGSAAGADATFTIKITSETTFDATVGGTTYYNLFLAAGGGLIDSFSIYTFGDSNSDSFWKSASLNNTGSVELGYALASGSFNPGLVTDGLSSTSASTASVNNVNIGGDAGSFVIFDQNNTYTGSTTVNANAALELQTANDAANTSGITVSNNGALKLYHATGQAFAAVNLTLNGTGVSGANGSLRSTGGANEWQGNITLASNSRIQTDTTGGAGSLEVSGTVSGGNNVLFVGAAGAAVTISGGISGAGNTQDGTTTSLFKDGTSDVTLTAANTYTGDTRVREGNLIVSGSGNLGSGSDVFLYGGASLTVNASTAVASVQEWETGNAGTVSVGSGAILTVNGADKGTLQQSTISGSGGLTLAASGNTVLRLYGNNTYSGATSVSGGTLQLAGTAGSGGLTGTSAVSLSGGVLLLSSSDVVNDSATVSLSGGTIQRGGNVSEVFGDLSVTSASFLDYGAANDVGTIRFGSYTPSSLLTVQNFLPGNKLQFGNTISSTDLNNASLFSFSSNFTTGTESGFFTITAIPEPSTYVAAAGLLALFLWPVRRRLIKDAKSILGLRPISRDRIEAYRSA
ncbi:MAG: beta strand repeat-containing protein [Chthoniobacterales bacterium]